MPDWFQVSYLGIVIFLTLTGIGLPIPEEVAIVAAGVASKAGALAWYKALAACLVGALLGDKAPAQQGVMGPPSEWNRLLLHLSPKRVS